MQYTHAHFAGDADFESASFAGDADFEASKFEAGGGFDDGVFRGGANFTNAKLNSAISFDGMRLQGPHRIARPAFLAGAAVFALIAMLSLGAAAMLPAWWGVIGGVTCVFVLIALAVTGAFGSWTYSAGEWDFDDRPLARGQTSIRILRKVAREALNQELEAIAHAAELKYSRLRWGKTWTQRLVTKPFERFFSIAYEMFADYGQSLVRPLVWIMALVALLGAGLYALDTPERLRLCLSQTVAEGAPAPVCPVWDEDAMWQAMDFSLSNTFRPLSALSTGNDLREQNPLAFRLLYKESDSGFGEGVNAAAERGPLVIDGPGFGVRLLATVQSLLALVLVFLAALAVKRRFQISA